MQPPAAQARGSICTRRVAGSGAFRTRSSDSFSVSRAWPEVAEGPNAGACGGTPGDDSLVCRPYADAPSATGLPTRTWDAPAERWCAASGTGRDRQPSNPPFLVGPTGSRCGQDRESFQATLRLGTLGGRIRPVKRRSRTIRACLITHCDRQFGGSIGETQLPARTDTGRTRSELAQTSIREVARRAGVSVGTVSNVLNRPDLVAEATRARVQAAIDELGFVRNESARRLRQGPDPRAGRPDDPARRAFGVIVEDLTNPYASDVARGAELALNASGHDALWLSSDNSAAKEQRSLELLEEQRAAGVLIIPIALDPPGIARLRATGMSVVLIDRDAPDACSARVDHVAGGEIAAAHLLGLGREDALFVTGRPEPRPCVERREGAARTFVEAGAGKPPTLVMDALSPTEGRAAAQRIAALPALPSGIFCANDLLAIGLINELSRLGVRVPDEVAVIGYDDIELAASAAVPLTTIGQPRRELGWEAAELVLAEVAEGRSHQHRQVVLTPELKIRESA
nr:LacI family DNA-binding transcriptional regulator [Spirillospora albida]